MVEWPEYAREMLDEILEKYDISLKNAAITWFPSRLNYLGLNNNICYNIWKETFCVILDTRQAYTCIQWHDDRWILFEYHNGSWQNVYNGSKIKVTSS